MAARGTVTKLLESAGGRKGVYEGEVDAAGKAVGHGVWRANEDTTVYTGDFADDKMHGHGEYLFHNGEKYVGEFKNGKRNGHGQYTYLTGKAYTGQWKDDLPDNVGSLNVRSREIPTRLDSNEDDGGVSVGDDWMFTTGVNGSVRSGLTYYSQPESARSGSSDDRSGKQEIRRVRDTERRIEEMQTALETAAQAQRTTAMEMAVLRTAREDMDGEVEKLEGMLLESQADTRLLIRYLANASVDELAYLQQEAVNNRDDNDAAEGALLGYEMEETVRVVRRGGRPVPKLKGPPDGGRLAADMANTLSSTKLKLELSERRCMELTLELEHMTALSRANTMHGISTEVEMKEGERVEAVDALLRAIAAVKQREKDIEELMHHVSDSDKALVLQTRQRHQDLRTHPEKIVNMLYDLELHAQTAAASADANEKVPINVSDSLKDLAQEASAIIEVIGGITSPDMNEDLRRARQRGEMQQMHKQLRQMSSRSSEDKRDLADLQGQVTGLRELLVRSKVDRQVDDGSRLARAIEKEQATARELEIALLKIDMLSRRLAEMDVSNLPGIHAPALGDDVPGVVSDRGVGMPPAAPTWGRLDTRLLWTGPTQ